MRLLRAAVNEFRFQFKYGFYLLYLLLTIIYIAILAALPQGAKGIGAAIIIYSDPAALGLFFMGAIVLFEKSERVLNSLFVSPLSPGEYVAGKAISLCAISLAVSIVLALCAGTGFAPLPLLLGTALGSVLTTFLGLVVAARISSLNSFILWCMPFELLLNVPIIVYLLGIDPLVLRVHPGIAMLRLLLAGMSAGEATALDALVLIIWLVPCGIAALQAVRRMRRTLGGIRL